MKIETQVKKTINEIKLPKNEKILVALSGGKDSAVVAFLLKNMGYNIKGFYIDLKIGDYSDKCRKAVEALCEDLGIKLYIYNFKKEQGKEMKYFWKKNKTLTHCAVCGVFKKWILNKESRRLKFKKIATGHNLDDEVETFLLNTFKGSPKLSSNIGPTTKNIKNKKFVTRIKPLFYLENKEIKKYAEKNKICFLEGVCPYRENSYRIQIRKFVETLSKKEKLNVIKNFEKSFKNFKKKNTKINYCKICGEPSRKEICKRCKLIKIK